MRTGTPIEMLTLFLLHPGKNNNVIPDTINIDRLALVLDSKKVSFTPILLAALHLLIRNNILLILRTRKC